MRMRCDPCKVRFLKVPWFLGHIVRCPQWEENGKDVIEYFSKLSKKKLMIVRRSSNQKKKNSKTCTKICDPDEETIRPPPPTCFTCFCGKSFFSQTRHSAHVQECLAKVMSTSTNKTPVTTPATSTTAKHTVVQLDDDHFKVIIQGSNNGETNQEEQVTFHADGEVRESGEVSNDFTEVMQIHNTVQETTEEAQDPLELGPSVEKDHTGDIQSDINPTSVDGDASIQTAADDDSVSMSHEESMDVLEKEVMLGTVTQNHSKLNETVLKLEFFEERLKPDKSHPAEVGNEIEVGTYEEVAQEFVIGNEEEDKKEEERVLLENPIRGRLPSIRPPDKTLDIEATICDCGKQFRSADDLTPHLQVCSVYSKTPQKPTPGKTVVLITCVCTGKFTKTDIKDHLLHCATWKYVKRKKNLEGARDNSEESQFEECIEETDATEETPCQIRVKSEGLVESEGPRSLPISDDNGQSDEVSQYVIEEIVDTGHEPELQISNVVTIEGGFDDHRLSVPNVQEEIASSATGVDDDHLLVPATKVTPKVTYKCECGAVFRHQNVFKVHQTSCSKCTEFVDGEKASLLEAKVAREDIILTYPSSMQGEVLVNRQCQCGLVIESICAYRTHIANCPFYQATKKKSQSKIKATVKPKLAPLMTVSQKRASSSKQGDIRNEDQTCKPSESTCGLKKSKVELQDELKDFVTLPSSTQPQLRSRRKK